MRAEPISGSIPTQATAAFLRPAPKPSSVGINLIAAIANKADTRLVTAARLVHLAHGQAPKALTNFDARTNGEVAHLTPSPWTPAAPAGHRRDNAGMPLPGLFRRSFDGLSNQFQVRFSLLTLRRPAAVVDVAVVIAVKWLVVGDCFLADLADEILVLHRSGILRHGTGCQGLAEDFEATGIYGAEGAGIKSGLRAQIIKLEYVVDDFLKPYSRNMTPQLHIANDVDAPLHGIPDFGLRRFPLALDTLDELSRREVAAHALPP